MEAPVDPSAALAGRTDRLPAAEGSTSSSFINPPITPSGGPTGPTGTPVGPSGLLVGPASLSTGPTATTPRTGAGTGLSGPTGTPSATAALRAERGRPSGTPPPPPTSTASAEASAFATQWERWFAELPRGDLTSLAEYYLPPEDRTSWETICRALSRPGVCRRAEATFNSWQAARAAQPPPPRPRELSEEQQALLSRLLEVMDHQDLVDAAVACELSVPASAPPATLARAIVLAGFGPGVLEQALASREEETHVAFPRAEEGGPPAREETPAVSSARAGPRAADPPATPPSLSPSPREADYVSSLLSRLQALERLVAGDGGSTSLSPARKASLLSPTATQPTAARMEQLTHVAKSAASAAADLSLTVPTLGPFLEGALAHNAQARYTASELSWAIQRQADELALQYQAWAAVSKLESELPEDVLARLEPVLRRFEDVWVLTHGHHKATLERLRQLGRGLVTKQWEELSPIPRSAGVLPPALITVEEVTKWKKVASLTAQASGQLAGKRVAEHPAPRTGKFHKPAPRAPQSKP